MQQVKTVESLWRLFSGEAQSEAKRLLGPSAGGVIRFAWKKELIMSKHQLILSFYQFWSSVYINGYQLPGGPHAARYEIPFEDQAYWEGIFDKWFDDHSAFPVLPVE